MKTTCVKCGKEIEGQTTTGRPKDYCSTGCRRAAEYEKNRINSRMGKLEDLLSSARLGCGFDPASDVEKLKAEIAIYEERLRVLLNTEEE